MTRQDAVRDHRRDAALAVGARDVDDVEGTLGVVEPGERVLHPLEPGLDAARRELVELLEEEAPGVVGGARDLSQLGDAGGQSRRWERKRAIVARI